MTNTIFQPGPIKTRQKPIPEITQPEPIKDIYTFNRSKPIPEIERPGPIQDIQDVNRQKPINRPEPIQDILNPNRGLLDRPQPQVPVQPKPIQPEVPVQPKNPIPKNLYQNQEPEETVESRLTNLLKKDNPYLLSARASAERKAASRGLLNSSIAAGAGESAAIQSALPIAQQDAQFYQQKNQMGQQAAIDSYLAYQKAGLDVDFLGRQGDQQARLYNVQGNITKKLAEQQHQYSIYSKQIDAKINKESAEKQHQYETSLKEMGLSHEVYMQKMKTEWDKIDLEARMFVERERLTAENQARFDDTVNKINEQYQKDVLEVMMNPHFKTVDDRNKAIAQITYLTEQRMKMAAQIAKVELKWTPPKSPYNQPPKKDEPPKMLPKTDDPKFKPKIPLPEP